MKNLSLFLVFMGLSLFGISQSIPQDVINLVNNCQYIFEGTVIRSDSYWGSPDSAIYTSNTLQIHKILKGNLVCGTVEVITRGGRVGDEGQIISHNLVLYKGLKGAFFCNPTNYDLSPIDFYPETNTDPLQVEFGEQGYLRYYYDGINKEVSNNMLVLDSIAQVYDAVELLTQFNYIDCEATITAPSSVAVLKVASTALTAKNDTHIDTQNREYVEKVNQKLQKAATNKIAATNELIYTFQNLQITQTFPRYFEFDVSLSASDNDSYIDNGLALVQYPKSLFGVDIVGNNKITVTRSTVIASVADYDDPIPLYENDSCFKVWIFAKTSNVTRYQLNTTPTPAFHVKIEYSTCNLLGVLRWGDVSKMSLYSLYTSTATGFDYTQYPVTTATGFHNIPRCLPEITDFNPKNVKAGVGDSVTISGKFFGQTRGTGKVSLRDADRKLLNAYISLDSIDYISWSDNQIKVRIASFNINANNLFGGGSHPAGSGKIIIKNSSSDTTSSYLLVPPNLTVDYAVSNTYESLLFQKKRIDLVDAYGPNTLGNGGYGFYIAKNIYNNPKAYATVKKALKDWQCLTKVPFVILDTLPSTWSETISVNDKKNVIQFGVLDPNTIMETSTFAGTCPNANGNAILPEVDIIINNTIVTWVYDTGAVSALQVDFYWSLLHELGHAHLLVHVTNPNDMMYGFEQVHPTPFNLRRINLASDVNAKNGGDDVINHSLNTAHGSCIPIANIVLLPPCVANAVEDEYLNGSLKVYPNPFSNVLKIELAEGIILSTELTNLLGQTIFKQNLPRITNEAEINVNGVNKGIYILNVHTNKHDYIVKLIKQ